MFDLEAQLDALVQREGGYVNHPADRGGPTRWGITEQVARAFGYTGAMKDLPVARAKDIYRERYWEDPNFDEVADRYPEVAEELFDTGVNMGTSVASKFLQRGLNLMNRGAGDYPDILADGRIGKITISTLDRYKAKRGSRGGEVLRKTLNGFQLERYAAIVEANPSQEAFMYGWVDQRI